MIETIEGASVQRQEWPNPNIRDYHCRQELTDQNTYHDRGLECRDSNGTSELMIAIPGVTRVCLYPYCAEVTKSPAYDWSEIEPQVLSVLARLDGKALPKTEGAE